MEFCVYISLLCFSCAYGEYRQTNQGCGLVFYHSITVYGILRSTTDLTSPFFILGPGLGKINKLAFFGGGGDLGKFS